MTDLDNGLAVENKGNGAKPLTARFKWVRGLFYASAVGMVLMFIGTLFVFFTDYTGYNPDIDVHASDMIIGVGALIFLPAFLGSIIAFSMFSYRAMKNLHIWETLSVVMSPGWAVGWYFIPVANLWKPYEAMDQIWDGSHDVTSGKTVPNSKIPGWWVLWIAMNFLSRIADFAAEMDGPWNIVLKRAAIFDLLAWGAGIVAILLIVPTLKTIAEKQDGHLKSLSFS